MQTKEVLERLAFIRYIHGQATKQSYGPEPINATALLGFHDSVELFLHLACEHLQVVSGKANFMDYWSLIAVKNAGLEPTQKPSMDRLNKARVALKHHGTRPVSSDIEAFRVNTTEFFKENVKNLLGVDFEQASLANLIADQTARQELETAETHIEAGNMEEALISIAKAFYMLLDNLDKSYDAGLLSSSYGLKRVYRFNDRPPTQYIHGMGSVVDTEKSIESLFEVVASMREELTILKLGLYYPSFRRFKQTIPYRSHTVNTQEDGSLSFGYAYTPVWPMSSDVNAITMDDCQFCFNFVIETALHLQRLEP